MNAITVMPCFSLEPTKLTLFNRVFKASDYNPDGTKREKTKRIKHFEQTVNQAQENITRSTHNLQLSDNAYRTLKKRINWLYYLAKSKSVKTYNGKQIYNFKIAFLTLTLSSKQKDPTADITNGMFNQFLTEIRQRTGMANYVWRLEFQENGNVHYHLVTDTYLDYYFVLPIWNRIQKNNGYIKEYKEKHENLSLLDYNKMYNPLGKLQFDTIAKRYAKSKSQKWEQPNSVDVRSVVSKKAIASYITKYFGKDSKSKVVKSECDNDENTKNLRLWFCSRSLSRVNSISNFIEATEYDITAIVTSAKNIKRYFAKFATVIYFEMFDLPDYCRRYLEPLLRNHAFSTGYQPSG